MKIAREINSKLFRTFDVEKISCCRWHIWEKCRGACFCEHSFLSSFQSRQPLPQPCQPEAHNPTLPMSSLQPNFVRQFQSLINAIAKNVHAGWVKLQFSRRELRPWILPWKFSFLLGTKRTTRKSWALALENSFFWNSSHFCTTKCSTLKFDLWVGRPKSSWKLLHQSSRNKHKCRVSTGPCFNQLYLSRTL